MSLWLFCLLQADGTVIVLSDDEEVSDFPPPLGEGKKEGEEGSLPRTLSPTDSLHLASNRSAAHPHKRKADQAHSKHFFVAFFSVAPSQS